MKYQTYTFYSANFEEFSNILNNHINVNCNNKLNIYTA